MKPIVELVVIKSPIFISVVMLCVMSCAIDVKPRHTLSQHSVAHFEWFDYSGDDEIFNKPLAKDEYQNPILAGFYPDPSIVRVGEDYYIVNSSFGFFPGIPVFHSRDLSNWTQIGNAVHRPEQMKFDGLPLSGAGIYAPAIEYANGLFYVISTCIGCGGNFVVSAADPAGPWSDPSWLPHIEGIDPSLFFDDSGKAYIVHHRNPSQKKYPAHTAIWVMEVDPQTFAPLSADIKLVDGGDESPWNTDYIEGPHIYKVNGSYYLSAPGGGTGYYHQQLVYKSDTIWGPYVANPNNPVLTQFGLPDDREHPVTATGHADMFQDTNGDWWAVFLGTRVYDLHIPPQDPGNFHTGRETFMLPVSWEDGWPVILAKGRALPYAVKKPKFSASPSLTQQSKRAMTGNFQLREEFSEQALAPHWLFIRTPQAQWWRLEKGRLLLEARAERLGAMTQPSFIGRRLAHMKASFGVQMSFVPQALGDEAGLLAIQNDQYFYAFGLALNQHRETVVRLREKAGGNDPTYGNTIAEARLSIERGLPIFLRVNIHEAKIEFEYSTDGNDYLVLPSSANAKNLSSAVAGGFTGAVIGMYAERAGQLKSQAQTLTPAAN